MALLFTTHTLTFFPISETADSTSKVVQVPTEGSGQTVAGALSPIRGRVVFDARTGDTLINPHSFLFELGDFAKVSYGMRATDGADTYVVSSAPVKHNAGGTFADLDCAEVTLEKVE